MIRIVSILCLLSLVFGIDAAPVIGRRVASHAQVSSGTTLLLDESGLGSAAAAYSVRKLRSAYAGSALRVRRSSDSTEQDIGFSGNNLDTSSLASFCSGTDGFVVTWYDQSGNGLNASQSTAANQPKIVSSGTVIVGTNSKPCLQCDGGDYFTKTGGAISITAFSAYAVASGTAGTDQRGFFSGTGAAKYSFSSAETMGFQKQGSSLRSATTTGIFPAWHIVGVFWNSPNIEFRMDGAADGTHSDYSATITGATDHVLSLESATRPFPGTISELVMWQSDKSSSKATAESNINVYYAVY